MTCPACQQETELYVPATGDLAPEVALSAEHILRAFGGSVPRTRTSFLYQIGLVIVAITMTLLPMVYVALIGAAGVACISGLRTSLSC